MHRCVKWSVPRLWEGQTIAVLAPGKTLPETIPQNIPAIAVGDAYRLRPDAAIVYHADRTWWRMHHERVGMLPALRLSCTESPYVDAHIELSERIGFDHDHSKVVSGHNSGYQALHIALHTGAKRIELHGYDMKGDHFFGKHPPGLRKTSPLAFELFASQFWRLSLAADELGVEVVNYSPDSALRCFPHARMARAS